MKFIKDMMTRKNRPMEIEDETAEDDAADLEDFGPEEPTDDELYSGIAAIQSMLDEKPDALNAEELAELEEDDGDSDPNKVVSAPAIVNFADLVSDIQKPKTEATPPAKAVVNDTVVKPKVAAKVEDVKADPVQKTAPRKPVSINHTENAKTANELSAALGPGVTVTVKDRPLSKHAAFDQKRFVSTIEADADDVAPPVSEQPKEMAPAKPVETQEQTDAAPRTPPKLVTATVEQETPTPTTSETKEPPAQANIIEVPAPAAGRSGRRAGRVKTRLLGFNHGDDAGHDPFDTTPSQTETTRASYPTGWIVIVDGPGRGTSFTLYNGVSQIGRGDDQPIKLGFGDTSISRSNHAAIAYDDQEHKFFLGHGGKANLVRLNDRPVLSTEEIT